MELRTYRHEIMNRDIERQIQFCRQIEHPLRLTREVVVMDALYAQCCKQIRHQSFRLGLEQPDGELPLSPRCLY